MRPFTHERAVWPAREVQHHSKLQSLRRGLTSLTLHSNRVTPAVGFHTATVDTQLDGSRVEPSRGCVATRRKSQAGIILPPRGEDSYVRGSTVASYDAGYKSPVEHLHFDAAFHSNRVIPAVGFHTAIVGSKLGGSLVEPSRCYVAT